jgi:hypothetical protein
MNALATPTQTALAKVRGDRMLAERRIAELEVGRASKLISDDIAVVERTDADIAAERRRIVICDQKIAALEAQLRRQGRNEREQRRVAAVKVIGGKLRKRQALAQEIEDTLGRLAGLYNELNDTKEIREAWPYPEFLPAYFHWGCGSLSWETMRTLARLCRDMLPGAVLEAIASSYAGNGIARVEAPSMAKGVAEVYASHSAHVLNTLAKVNIHPPGEDDADNEEAA